MYSLCNPCRLFSWVLVGKKHALIHDIRSDHKKRQCHDSTYKITRFFSFTLIKVRKQLKPHLPVCLIKDDWSMLANFVSEEPWMDVLCKLNIQATGMSKWSKLQPRFRVSSSKWKTGWEHRTEERICSSCMSVHTVHDVALQLTPSTCFGAISWDRNRYCGVTHKRVHRDYSRRMKK